MRKPDWETAPFWADFLAQDNDGGWWWFEERPQLGEVVWWAESGNCCHSRNDDWRSTLEERPTRKEAEE
jgi:hypothetical protein